ncbi:hypothetical protein, conserved [Entamoeba dispar SAW760]|uniref:ATP-grasp domain-containing protein n=1 Tax=Entamoeba dispar (strain ATCC PRA-260 / SAW760) TaxID=370354 RepID=B0EEF5_ENTDS|nr:uncharacterized protein EDI_135220 [Entamoeba dispar SAW760]EDR27069.1 hypothetical protein, conserved [Entamoeba dispar SAW760]|eukprot:EDR27069.1 hypothetical protein, conserved [Entamoeba dispar SAW760]
MQFEPLFNPKSVAVIGASDRKESVGYAVMNNMIKGGYKGHLYPVGRKPELFGMKCYAKIGQIEEKVDLAVIAIPAKFVPGVCIECGEAGVKGLIIITAGFAEAGEEGKKMCIEIQATCQKYNMRMIGPNCLGIINPRDGVNASFASVMPEAGGVAFISQSGALCTAILDWAANQHVGFSYFVSIGSSIDTDYADLFEFFAKDPKVTSILMYIESIKDAKKFVLRAREFAADKPIILLKAGKSSEGAAAAMSHTGSLAGNDAVYDAVFDRCGCIRVDSICDLWDCAHVLATQNIPQNNRLCIITNAGGPGVISTDRLVSVHGHLAKLSESTMTELNGFLSPFWSHSNPVDVLGDATASTYQKTLDVVIKDPQIDGVVVVLTPQAMTDPVAVAKSLVEHGPYQKPVLASWMGQSEVEAGVKILEQGKIPNFETPERAVTAFGYIMRHPDIAAKLKEIPKYLDVQVDYEGAKKLIADVVADGRTTFTEYEGKMMFSKYGIPIKGMAKASTEDEAVAEAMKIGTPVVMKILSPDIMHKTDVGGVKVKLTTEEEIRKAYRDIMTSVKEKKPEARIHGVLLEKMVGFKYECIIGCKKDPLFGPVIVFGMGGVTVELYKDTNIALPPIGLQEADRLIDGTKISKLLRGYRGMPACDVEGLKKILVQFSKMIMDFPEISEVDINPLAVSYEEFLVLDAKIVLDKNMIGKEVPKYSHLVIQP